MAPEPSSVTWEAGGKPGELVPGYQVKKMLLEGGNEQLYQMLLRVEQDKD